MDLGAEFGRGPMQVVEQLARVTSRQIFYYQFFDADKDVFANLTVFEFQPASFNLQRRIFAASARWDAGGPVGVRERLGEDVCGGDECGRISRSRWRLSRDPRAAGILQEGGRQSQEMSYSELARYIYDLQQSGFDTMRLRVQLNRKLAYPLITLVMAMLAIPFALSMGKRGGLAGIGIGDRDGDRVLGGGEYVRSDGQCEYAAADAGGVDAGCAVRDGGELTCCCGRRPEGIGSVFA